MRFIDLFAGLGGFHVAMNRLGHECVFASELNRDLASLYEKNFGMKNVYSDIKKVHESSIPKHDIMCAGFPCQPFSKAGKQLGIADARGNFIEDFERILKFHKPKYFILENVPHLKKHDRENSFKLLKNTLESCGYEVADAILSPHEFGIPQLRNRIYIVGALGGLGSFKFPEKSHNGPLHISKIMDKSSDKIKKISNDQIECLNMWQNILDSIPKEVSLPSFPIWSMEWEATYPYDKKPLNKYTFNELKKFRGKHGIPLKNAKSKQEAISMLPLYAQTKDKFPSWKTSYIRRNREFYRANKKYLKPFIKQLKKYYPSWQKLEWNCQNEERKIFNNILQFRPSGIRIKRPNYAPALVVNQSQQPVIGWEKRYLSKTEAAKLQDIHNIELPESNAAAYRALGNAVNVHLITLIGKNLIGKKRGPRKNG